MQRSAINTSVFFSPPPRDLASRDGWDEGDLVSIMEDGVVVGGDVLLVNRERNVRDDFAKQDEFFFQSHTEVRGL